MARFAGQARLGSAVGFGKVLGEVVATVSSPTDAKRMAAAATPATGASPATQVAASSDASAAEADVPGRPAQPSLLWAHIAAGIKIASQTATAKLGAGQAAGAMSGSKEATSDGDAAIRAGQDGKVPSPAPAIPDMVDPSPSDAQATKPVTSPSAAPALSNTDDPVSSGPNPTSLGAIMAETFAAHEAASLAGAASASAPVGAAVQTSTASTASRNGSGVPGTKAAASGIAFWSPLKVWSNSQSSGVAGVATVSGGDGGAGAAPEAAHPAPTSGAPYTAAASDPAAALTGTRAGQPTEDPSADSARGLSSPAAAAGDWGLPSTTDSGAAAVVSTVTQAALEASVGADATANSQGGSREHGHANGVSAVPSELTATEFAEVGESTAPSVQHSASPTPASPGPDTAALSVANQVAPALAAMVQARNIGRALSVSVTPDNLGSISITVSRAADGTSVIQLGAERVSTLEMLHASQAELGQSLDQAGVGHGNHALSFAWNGADAGSSWAGAQSGQREQQGEPRPAPFASSTAEDALTRSQNLVADTDRVDVTA